MTVTREEFHRIYTEQLEPVLKLLEEERVIEDSKNNKIIKPLLLIGCVAFIMIFVLNSVNDSLAIVCFFIVFFTIFPVGYILNKSHEKRRKFLKERVFPKILSLHGQFYFSQNPKAITLVDINRKMGLYNRSTTKTDDDTVVGIYKGCNLLINECELTHIESRGKHSRTVTDFKGLIIKIQMKKNFKGVTILGSSDNIRKLKGFENVELESVDFMQNRKVYSTDQIEARYLLTTAFMERVQSVAKSFMGNRSNNMSSTDFANIELAMNQVKSVPLIGAQMSASLEKYLYDVSVAFIDGYIYLFINSFEDFFDIDLNAPISGADPAKYSLLGEEKYYNIYNQLSAILGIIDYLKLDKNLGL